jgi:hypothetical protein
MVHPAGQLRREEPPPRELGSPSAHQSEPGKLLFLLSLFVDLVLTLAITQAPAADPSSSFAVASVPSIKKSKKSPVAHSSRRRREKQLKAVDNADKLETKKERAEGKRVKRKGARGIWE